MIDGKSFGLGMMWFAILLDIILSKNNFTNTTMIIVDSIIRIILQIIISLVMIFSFDRAFEKAKIHSA